MTTNQLLIPDKLRIGFVNRDDTYTGKLAYIIYYDNKGKLRKETSWQNWRNQSIDPMELNNEPTEGFVLNKGVGGVKHSYGWNPRNEYIRVYDPRGFEFEISVPNLLFILQQCDCSRGKGIEGKLVYSWDGKELVLLPIESQEYKDSTEYTKLQAKKVSAKDLIKGATYLTKKEEKLIYLGRLNKYNNKPEEKYIWHHAAYKTKPVKPVVKQHVFIQDKEYVFLNSMNRLSVCIDENPVQNYPELLDKYLDSEQGSPIQKFEFVKTQYQKTSNYYQAFYYKLNNGRIFRYGLSDLPILGKNRYEAYYLDFHKEMKIDDLL